MEFADLFKQKRVLLEKMVVRSKSLITDLASKSIFVVFFFAATFLNQLL